MMFAGLHFQASRSLRNAASEDVQYRHNVNPGRESPYLPKIPDMLEDGKEAMLSVQVP